MIKEITADDFNKDCEEKKKQVISGICDAIGSARPDKILKAIDIAGTIPARVCVGYMPDFRKAAVDAWRERLDSPRVSVGDWLCYYTYLRTLAGRDRGHLLFEDDKPEWIAGTVKSLSKAGSCGRHLAFDALGLLRIVINRPAFLESYKKGYDEAPEIKKAIEYLLKDGPMDKDDIPLLRHKEAAKVLGLFGQKEGPFRSQGQNGSGLRNLTTGYGYN